METSGADLENATTTNTTWRRDGEDAAAAAADTGRYHVYFLLVVYPIVFLFGVFGNTLVITIVLKYAKLLV